MSERVIKLVDSPCPLPEVDCPAAHSMDSTWFALDRDGFVAHFSTGEAGCMPEEAAGSENGNSSFFHDQIVRAAPASGVIYDYRGLRRPDQPERTSDWGFRSSMRHEVLMFMPSLDPIRQAIAEGRAREVQAAIGKAVRWTDLSDEEFQRLEQTNSFTYWSTIFEYEQGAASLSEHGVYIYGHLCENWISGPYGREEIPAVPIHVDQLPAAVRKQLKAFSLENLAFADTVHLQPAEHTPCVSWEPAWLSLDGKTRNPFPGREAEFETFEAEHEGE